MNLLRSPATCQWPLQHWTDKPRTEESAVSDTERCSAAHADDPTPCVGPGDAVTILDGQGNAAAGCEHHGARMLASIDGARVEPGSVVGAATRVLVAADTIRPFCWYENAPRTELGQLSHAENRANA